ncbi:Glycoside hydrolase [Macleaya cordata]|uniref:Glycoside hydrolase n=1 Tax=Macleaya cordata TaxID=56857 RepID=A0A200R896_MACCD|nr:Glycoside hydrolase [Macleaya cordata]
MGVVSLQTILLVSIVLFGSLANSFPLSTNGKCASHMETMLVEGLSHKPLPELIEYSISSLGFNCVRLMWSTYMFTRNVYGSLTIERSFESLNLKEGRDGIAKNNPSLLKLTVVEAYEKVVDELGAKGIMVVPDNHRDFDPKEWLEGLAIVAKRFQHKPQVVAMSMRNELRGPHQTQQEWFQNVHEGAKRIHTVNPNSFLPKTPEANLDNKLVYEGHWYSFTGGKREEWQDVQPGRRGVIKGDNQFLSCFLAYVAERDLDWAMWALQGSYYRRNDSPDFEEYYGVLGKTWNQTRNPKFEERYRLIQQKLQAVGNGLPGTVSTDCSSKQSIWKVISSSKLQLATMDEQGKSLCLENNSNSSTILIKECLCPTDDEKC